MTLRALVSYVECVFSRMKARNEEKQFNSRLTSLRVMSLNSWNRDDSSLTESSAMTFRSFHLIKHKNDLMGVAKNTRHKITNFICAQLQLVWRSANSETKHKIYNWKIVIMVSAFESWLRDASSRFKVHLRDNIIRLGSNEISLKRKNTSSRGWRPFNEHRTSFRRRGCCVFGVI